MIRPLVTLESGRIYGINLKKSIDYHLTKCKNYEENTNNVMKCMLENQINCFLNASNNCKCVPMSYHSHFDICQPINRFLQYCETKLENDCAEFEMLKCYFNKNVSHFCPTSCKEENYSGTSILYHNANRIRSNQIQLMLKYSTMNVNVYQEYYMYDICNFIGAISGSFVFVIGFTYSIIQSFLVNTIVT